MIRETYMAPGDFRVSMEIETPHLMATVKQGGYLVITPQHLGDPRGFTDASLLAAARYTGIVLETIWTDGVLTLEGAGLDWIFGNLDGIGWPCPARTYSATAITSVIASAATTGIIPLASFSIGSTITGPAYTGTHTTAETVKEVLMQVMEAGASHYKLESNGEINCELVTANNVYKSTPEVVFLRDQWGSDAMWIGSPVDSLRSRYSIREWLYSSNVFYYGLNNAVIQRSDTTTPLTTREIEGGELQIQEIRTHQSQINVGASVGDMVYIHDPGSGFEGTDVIAFRGQYLKPQKLRIHEVEWPILEGMGVYYRPGQGTAVTSDDWVDLTATSKRLSPSKGMTYIRAQGTNIEAGC